MPQPAFRFEALSSEHNRDDFSCREEILNRYLRTQATQDVRRRVANCFVALEIATKKIAGYYTISAASIELADLPKETSRKLPRYPSVPAVRLGRLAVDQRFQGQGMGAALLADAMTRAMQSPPAVFAVVVDAKNDEAVAFYVHHGFRALNDKPYTLYLPLATAAKARL